MTDIPGDVPPPSLPPMPSRPQPNPMTPRPPVPQVLRVTTKPDGLSRVVTIITGLFMFGLIFIIGVGLGIFFTIAASEFEQYVIRHTYRDGGGNRIAIIPVSGIIDQEQSEFVHHAVNNVLDDPKTKAIVLRVDSPGGGVTSSDQIWYEVNRLKNARLPVVASYGGIAASGGYYISCASDFIMAEETCITGSIGVIAQILTLEGLLDKVGIEPVTLVATHSPEKNTANDIFRSWDERDKQIVITMLDASYATFNKRIQDGRKHIITDSATIDSLANGSIFSADQALENGLIDGIGYLDDAITQAEKLAGVPTSRSSVYIINRPPSLFSDGLLLQRRADNSMLDADRIRTFVNDLASPRVM